MRTAAQETATQIALRSCSKEEGDICDFGEGEILAIKHLFFPITFLLVTRSSHFQEFWCFSRLEEIKELCS